MSVSYAIFFLLSGITTVFVGWRIRQRQQRQPLEPVYLDEKTPFHDNIEPLPNFDYQNEEPLQLRPFKPIYHITMALQSATQSTLIHLDKNYLTRILARQNLLQTQTSIVLGSLPESLSPLQELYIYLLKTYLPNRFPSIFSLSPDNTYFHNKITHRSFPLIPIPTDRKELLKTIGETVEEDMFLLREVGGKHVCVAFICCHPSGFDPSTKLGKTLKEIHGPVPGYERIEVGMERFFKRLEGGKRVKRVNWGIQTHSSLYSPSTNHIHPSDESYTESTPEEIDINSCNLRVELQSLMRLPDSKALLFSFKTFLYPLTELKRISETEAKELADAIDGLSEGNVPLMKVYKGGVKWGKVVCEYLRG
ncbi:hypothetical protein QBC38DRAFT_486521 [Podospora fimiseda]|uniref:Uncharacterized protein n=1 Tax=Podospora fimiseda TaxID=252190 RepID=A0AAN7GW92_9PEZI|nr:hypothetical protein QBC38DRAFT_486521 [Podospora fimiseda]